MYIFWRFRTYTKKKNLLNQQSKCLVGCHSHIFSESQMNTVGSWINYFTVWKQQNVFIELRRGFNWKYMRVTSRKNQRAWGIERANEMRCGAPKFVTSAAAFLFDKRQAFVTLVYWDTSFQPANCYHVYLTVSRNYTGVSIYGRFCHCLP